MLRLACWSVLRHSYPNRWPDVSWSTKLSHVALFFTLAFCACSNLDAAERGIFRDPAAALKEKLGLWVRCGRFSYARIEPACILGVSGTIEALGDYEMQVRVLLPRLRSEVCSLKEWGCPLHLTPCSSSVQRLAVRFG